MKHKEIINAWLNGAIVEGRAPGYEHWYSLLSVDERTTIPAFSDKFEYRIKPMFKYRPALFKTPLGVFYVAVLNSPEFEKKLENEEGFIRWLTNWIEYEPEPVAACADVESQLYGWYRTALFSGSSVGIYSASLNMSSESEMTIQENRYQECANFIRWLTPRTKLVK